MNGTSIVSRRATVARLVVWSAVGAAPALVSGRCVERALDHGFLAGHTAIGIAWLAPMAVAGLLGAMAVRRVTPLIGECVEPYRERLVRGVVAGHLRAGGHPGGPADPPVVARAVGQTDTVRDISASLLGESCQLAATFVAATVGLFSLDPLVGVIVALPVLVTLALGAGLVPTLSIHTRAVVQTDEDVAAAVTATALGRRDIVACGAEDQALMDCGRAVDANAAAQRRLARRIALRTVTASIGGQAPTLLLLASAPWLLQQGRLSVGGLLGALTYVSTGLQPALNSAVGSAAGSLIRLHVVRGRLAVSIGAPRPQPLGRPGRVPTDLDLRTFGLTFSHGAGAHPIVRDLDLTIAFGDHVAVVGPSGVGKSTLIDLLVGLTPPDAGHVSIGGVPLAGIPSDRLRRLITLVPQEAYVFTGTLRDNLVYLRPTATDEEVMVAAAATGLLPLVERLGGLDAALGATRQLSEGERQHIVVTRAWLSPAPIVILDEGTCHMDPVTEALAEGALRERAGTLIVVAHRISSAQRADRILLMDGATTATGRHDELRLASPAYADLVGHW